MCRALVASHFVSQHALARTCCSPCSVTDQQPVRSAKYERTCNGSWPTRAPTNSMKASLDKGSHLFLWCLLFYRQIVLSKEHQVEVHKVEIQPRLVRTSIEHIWIIVHRQEGPTSATSRAWGKPARLQKIKSKNTGSRLWQSIETCLDVVNVSEVILEL